MNLYQKIKKKKGLISALAPMEGVTDSVFRQIIDSLGSPDLFFTEFLNVEGFCSKGREKVSHRIMFTKKEKPIIVQLWGNQPEYYAQSVKEIKKLKPDGFDINIGCSVRDILSGGRGSALILEKGLVSEIIDAVKSESENIPVSVKTRLGYDHVDVENWIGFLLKEDLDLITIHGRISKEGYSSPAKWDDLSKCVTLRDEIAPNTMILGNGDLRNSIQGEEYVKKYHVDGYMIGRAVMNNPWLFTSREDISEEEKIQTLLKHMKLFKSFWNDSKPFDSQKKYIKAYLSEFEGVNELRKTLMESRSVEEMEALLVNYLK